MTEEDGRPEQPVAAPDALRAGGGIEERSRSGAPAHIRVAFALGDEETVPVERSRGPLRLQAGAQQRHEPLGGDAQAQQVRDDAVLQHRHHDGEDWGAGQRADEHARDHRPLRGDHFRIGSQNGQRQRRSPGNARVDELLARQIAQHEVLAEEVRAPPGPAGGTLRTRRCGCAPRSTRFAAPSRSPTRSRSMRAATCLAFSRASRSKPARSAAA